ncbi:MAG: hypothetical protein Tsb009_37480 [Planctomycetaceae bacterium]
MSRFFRLNSDRTCIPVPLDNHFAGTSPSACWLIGGGPSLPSLRIDEIANSTLPKMCINLSGTRLLRPTFWTSYDPTVRFHRSIYLDPSVMKFVHRRRAFDVVPETNHKVCDCPNLLFFDRLEKRGFSDLLSQDCEGIVDWADSMVQAIEILFRLGFRKIYLAGCDMRINPSREQISLASRYGVTWEPFQLLHDFLRSCQQAGLSEEELDRAGPGKQYHFEEWKPIRAAAATDFHYFRVAQYLRLSRRAISLAGLQLISVTPHSRLNDYFPYEPVGRVLTRIRTEVGNPSLEHTSGLYTSNSPRPSSDLGPMRDFRPHGWPSESKPQPSPKPSTSPAKFKPLQGEPEILVEKEGFEPSPEEHHPEGKKKRRLREFAINLGRNEPELNEDA